MLEIYCVLFDKGWTLSQIDEMDIFYYFKMISYKNNVEETAYIDQVL
jgi:hypothetical protein